MKVTVRGVTGDLVGIAPWFDLAPAYIGEGIPEKLTGYKEMELLESSGKIVKLIGVALPEIEITLSAAH
jgi:hypothetical protein